jgi:type VI secretion system secreted protein VgrG
MTVIIEAGMQLSLKVGGNFIDIGPAGVSIQGTMVMINSGGAAGSGCGSSPTDPTDPKDPDEADDGSKGTKMND